MRSLAELPRAKKTFLVQEFAEVSGVTVRTLHHYDRLGLLKPLARTNAGYRVYGEADLARLEQIIALKFLGLSLDQIRDLLERQVLDIREALHMQREALEKKRRELDAALRAIIEAEQRVAAGSEPGWHILKGVITAMQEKDANDWAMKYYSEEARQKVEERKALWNPELQEQVTRDWNALFRDIEAAQGEDPAGPVAQSLVERWNQLLAGFTGGDPQIQEGLNKMYADQANWKTSFQRPWSDAVDQFMKKARAAGGKSCP